MNRIIGPVAIAAAALAVKVVAQTPAAQSPDPNVVIVSGCVQSAASPPSSSTSVKLGTPGVTEFLLANPVIGGTAAPGAVGSTPSMGMTPGTTSTPSPTRPGSTAAPTPATPPSTLPPSPTAPTTPPTTTSPSNPALSVGTTGTSAATATESSTMAYRLTGGQDLAQFANQRVEIHGAFQDIPRTGDTAASSRVSNATRTLRINSVRALGGSCQAGGRQ